VSSVQSNAGTRSFAEAQSPNIDGRSQRTATPHNTNSTENTDPNECIVCHAPRDHIIYSCGHFCLCGACVAKLREEQGPHFECPICSKPVMDVIRVYL
jgi:ferredoxin